jgi:CubicO group peptidase (beta-lactamase class C family)
MRKLFIAFFLLAVSVSFAQDFRQVADSIRIRRRIPALTYALFSSDSIYSIGAVGYKILRTKDTVNFYNRYHLGSATASFTAYVAAQLVNKGKINWNTSVFKLFPEFKNKATNSKDITLSDLLSQRSGLPPLNNYKDLYIIPEFPGTVYQKRILAAEWILSGGKQPIENTQGNRFLFTNANALIAGIMLEKVTGKSWEDLVMEYVNKPLGISVKFGFPNRLDKNQTWGHWGNEGGVFQPLAPDHWYAVNPVYAPAADVNITVTDYVKFIQDHLRGINGKKSILPTRIYEVLDTSYSFHSFDRRDQVNLANDILEMDGTAGSFYTHAEIIPSKNIGIIVMANGGDNACKAGVLNLTTIIREAVLK